MKLIVTIKFISPENGGRKQPVTNGYRPSLRAANTGLRDCVFNLPSHVALEQDKTYNNVQIELIHPNDKFAVHQRIYIYEGNRLVAEAIINKIIP